ncbi:MAG: asparagine synthase (glutamine-hydrolyzing) [Mycobacteriales bacterium]|nr:asparagine synthase (glutamine-hydrolyzing) [Frankia sp.]MCA1833593.1 asparagine synthase (glutamine-hydrolyzing) [Actinomycetota bacterium]
MCGIAGVASCDRDIQIHEDAIIASLHNRGPDDHDVTRWSGAGAGGLLAHTRLAIVDLTTDGRQPVWSNDGRFAMVYNGEIYNHRSLRSLCERRGHHFRSQMDGEVIVHLWRDEGARCLDRLNGIFAVAVADTETGELFLARDPLGVKPIFYSATAESCWFGSEPATLAALGAPSSGHDTVALAQFLTFLWIPDPASPERGISAVKPGHVVHWRAGDAIAELAYCRPLFPAPVDRVVSAHTAHDTRERLRHACERQLLGDVPVGLMASGGIDSSLLWWGGREGLARAFTIEWPQGASDEQLDEDAAAVRVLEHGLGTPVDYLPGADAPAVTLPRSGDLFADPAYELARFISQQASRSGYKVLWCGQGADELFGGYRRHRAMRLLSRSGWRAAARFGAAVSRGTRTGLRGEYAARFIRAAAARDEFSRYLQLCTYSTAEDRARVLDCETREVADDVVWARHRDVFEQLPQDVSPYRRALALDLNVYLPGLGLAYMDRAGMEFGVEVRVPWLDLDLVRWSLSLPDRALSTDGGKGPPRNLAREVLPPTISSRAKRGFAAPTSQLRQTSAAGELGFRQGTYFARAAGMVRELLGTEKRG